MHEGWYPGVRLEDQVRRRNKGLVVTRDISIFSELNLRTILQHTNSTTMSAFRRLISWQWGYKIRSEDQNEAIKAWPWQETSASIRSEFTDQFTVHQPYNYHCLSKIKVCVLATRSDNQVGGYEGIVNSNIVRSGWVVCPEGPMPPGGSLAPLDNYYFLDTQKIFIPIVPTTQAEHIVVPPKPNQICIKEQNILLKTQWRACYRLESTDLKSPLEMSWFLRKSTSQVLYVNSNLQDPRVSFATPFSDIITYVYIVPSHHGCHRS